MSADTKDTAQVPKREVMRPAPRTFSLVPSSLGEAMQLAKMIADSDMAPKDYRGKPGNVVIAIQMGADVGLKPMQALQNIAVINGRPSIWGDAALALVQASGICEKFREYFEGERGSDTWTAVCEMKRANWPDLIVRKFSVADAKKAKLWQKTGRDGQATPWVTYEDRMLQMRARGFTIRDGAADVLMGLILAEEAMDYPEVVDMGPASRVDAPAVFDRLPEGLRDTIEKAFTLLNLPAGLRLTKLNEFLGGDGVDLEDGAQKLLNWCRDEYAARQGKERAKPKGDQNGKGQGQDQATHSTDRENPPSAGTSGQGTETSSPAKAAVTPPPSAAEVFGSKPGDRDLGF